MALLDGTPYRIRRFDNGRQMRSGVAFDDVAPNLSTLKICREHEGLDRLADEAPDEFALIRGVMDCVKRRRNHP